MEEEHIGSKRKPPSCSRCSNHGKDSPLTHHKCPYEECDCLLCKLTWARKIVMRRQQQLWRRRKETQKWEELAAEAVGGGGGGGGGEGETDETGGKQKEKYCDLCRNHSVLVRNRGHKRSCKFENCECDICSFTRKRRQIMQLQQKVKRSKFTTQQFKEATDWVTKLTAELISLGIDDVPMPTLSTPMPSTSNLQPRGSFPGSSSAESAFPSAIPAALFPPAPPVEPFHSPSCSRMTRPFMSQAEQYTSSTSFAMDHGPSSSSTSFLMDPGPSSSTSFPMDPGPSSSSSLAVAAAGVSSSFVGSSNTIHMPMESSSSAFASLCHPSRSCTPLSASPHSDYDPSYPGCPSPLSSYNCSDNTNREMTSLQQQSCAVIRNTPSAAQHLYGDEDAAMELLKEPLDCSDQHMHSSRSHKHAENRLHEHTENPSRHNTNRSLYGNPQSNPHCWTPEQRNPTDMTQEKYWPGQRRKSDGVIQPPYQHSQRRNSDSIIQTIYRPSQRRNSDGVIKKFYGQNPRGNTDSVIQEGYSPEDRRASEEEPQASYKTDTRDSSEGVIEEGHGAEERIQSVYQLGHRRNSDGVILMSHRLNERRNSDGVIRKCYPLTQRGNIDRVMPKHVLYPSETSSEGIHGTFRENERRGSDEISQDSYGMDQRRHSSDYMPENYGSSERRNSDEVLRSFYWPYPRSDSGETIPENNWPNQRRDSDEFIQRNYPSSKDHFFENNLRREHEALERLNRTVPMTDGSVNLPTEPRPYITMHPPMGQEEYQQATGIRKDVNVTRVDTDVNVQHTMMNWSTHHVHEEINVRSQEQSDEDMDRPLDLTTRPSTKQ